MSLKLVTNNIYVKGGLSVLIVVILVWVSWLKLLVYPIRDVERNCHDGDPCVCFEGALKYQKWDNNLSRLVGRSYAAGQCVSQDIDKAKSWFKEYQKDSKLSVGALLFYSAGDFADMSERPLTEANKGKIRLMIKEAIALGFQPTDQDYQSLVEGSSFKADMELKPQSN